ncbi:hypothetical protein GNY06_03980 [Elizabethkingia argentiflava]|uniref:Uncharacterized protein n=1 Tax=Elizabethkingia argenteiflava TaxID=2681556 RepID=A0A845PVS8_9FLAO|nr:hypothetical protein [Elizabethkingia argenteiflava]NAW50577.1 hypothetical protein [Elizabethkingia argenteiflava]
MMTKRSDRIKRLHLISILQKKTKAQYYQGIISKEDYIYTLKYIYDNLCRFEDYTHSIDVIFNLIEAPIYTLNIVDLVDLATYKNLN